MELPCRRDPEMWFSDSGPVAAAAARKCGGCPLKVECLELGLSEEFGVWGGMARRERMVLVRKRRSETRDRQRAMVIALKKDSTKTVAEIARQANISRDTVLRLLARSAA